MQHGRQAGNPIQLRWTREELEASHAFASPHEVAGVRLHGGLDAAGRYVSPRALGRAPAVANWRSCLEARGVELVEANLSLLKEDAYPNPAQQKLLLEHGLGQTLFNSLTNIGRTEAKGAIIGQIPVPDFQSIIEEDIGDTCLAHLDKGLFDAHGWDEGGREDSGEGAHDQMWFAARDLLWPPGTYDLPPELPGNAPAGDAPRTMPQISAAHERVLGFMMMVLMIEIKAYRGFALNEDIMRDPAFFRDRRPEADLAAELVSRIRQDEDIHVAYLQTALSEFRHLTVRTDDGSRVPGSAILDGPWQGVRHLSGVVQPRQQRAEMEGVMRARILEEPRGKQILEAYQSLQTPLAA